MCGQRCSGGGVPDESDSSLLVYGEVLDKASNIRNGSMGWLAFSPVRPGEVLRQHGGSTGYDDVVPREEGLCEQCRGNGFGVHG